MGFSSMFSAHHSPIAVDFGTSSVKLLQISRGDQPQLVAATELMIPDAIRSDGAQRLEYYAQHLPALLKESGFKGRRALCSVPCHETHIQHMQIAGADNTSLDNMVKTQLQIQLGCAPDAVVVRPVPVTDVNRDGQSAKEVICFAIARDTVMRYVDLLKRCRLDVVGVHGEPLVLLRAFDHLHRRDGDDKINTLYIDMGWGGTKVAISHGKKLVFARNMQVGGQHFDQLIADTLECDLQTARNHRLSNHVNLAPQQQSCEQAEPAAALSSATAKAHAAERNTFSDADAAVATDQRSGQRPPELQTSIAPGVAPSGPCNVDFSELLDSLCDEMSMCLRYHRGLFSGQGVDRAIFLGGEARHTGLCQHIARALALPAQLGDPVARLGRDHNRPTPGVNLKESQPGWAVAYGLCAAPADL